MKATRFYKMGSALLTMALATAGCSEEEKATSTTTTTTDSSGGSDSGSSDTAATGGDAAAADTATSADTSTTDTAAPDTAAAAKNLVEVAMGNPDFSTLVAAVKAAGLVDTLQTPGPFTVFAPTNAAFAKVPKADLDKLLADKAKLTAVLTYHALMGAVMAKDVKAGVIQTVAGAPAKLSSKDGKWYINNALITATDVQASNGVIHVIDTVLMPPGNVVEVAVGNPDFSTLVAAVTAANLVTTLSGAGPFTIFAPNNAAFAKIPKADLDKLLADKPALQALLTYHVVSGAVYASAVKAGKVKTVNGAEVEIAVDANGGVTVGGAKVIATDVLGSNGVIHVLDTVISPPAK